MANSPILICLWMRMPSTLGLFTVMTLYTRHPRMVASKFGEGTARRNDTHWWALMRGRTRRWMCLRCTVMVQGCFPTFATTRYFGGSEGVRKTTRWRWRCLGVTVGPYCIWSTWQVCWWVQRRQHRLRQQKW